MILAAGIEPTLDLSGLSTGLVYLVVFGFIFVESGILLGFFLPGDSLLFGAGLLAASPRSGVDLHVLVVGVTLAAILGDAVGFWTGRRIARSRVAARPRTANHIARAEKFYARHGAAAVVLARWVPWVRTATPVVAGIAGMPYKRFLVANVAGAITWAAGLVLLGYYAYEVPWLRRTAIAIAAASILIFVVALVGRRVRGRAAARRGGARPEFGAGEGSGGDRTGQAPPERSDR